MSSAKVWDSIIHKSNIADIIEAGDEFL